MREPLELKLQSKNYMDCLDILIYSVACWLKRDYRMQYAEAWGFDYSCEPKKRIYERIGCGRGEEYKYLEKYHGIKLLPINITEEEFAKLVETEEIPLLFQYDAFWANWMEDTYQRLHMFGHHVLVTGYNKNTKEVFILDSQEASEGRWCSSEEFYKGIVSSYKIRPIDNYNCEIEEKEVLEIILGRVSSNESQGKRGIVENMELFIEDMENVFDIELEVRPYLSNFVECRLLTTINDVAKSRKKAAVAIECIRESSGNGNLTLLANRLHELGELWKQAFGVFVKYCYMNDNDRIRKKVVKKLKEIKDKEAEAIQFLQECYSEEQIVTLPKSDNKVVDLFEEAIPDYCCKHINIEKYYNNMGCYGMLSDETKAELSNPYRYLWVEGNEISGFDTQNMLEEKYDNIICQRQKILVDEQINEHSKIMFLMCSEFTSCEILVELNFDDGSSENLKVGVTSWLYPEPEYSDRIALAGTPVQRKGEGVPNAFCYNFSGNIYSSWYKMKCAGKRLKTILLPECENVHVFAISIANYVGGKEV